MSVAYYQVLLAMDIRMDVVGRDQKSAQEFFAATGVMPITGGIENYLHEGNSGEYSHAIIATGPEKLSPVLQFVLKLGIERVLVEKPAALSLEELQRDWSKLEPYADQVQVAYNRRFYRSFEYAQELIEEDGGLESVFFEFTELIDRVQVDQRPKEVLANWFFANSTHVIDMAFAFAGIPQTFHAVSMPGDLFWHEKTKFAGAGITEKGVLFSYLSTWESAGRWGIELMTKKRRIILKPLEKVQYQLRNTFDIKALERDYSLDEQFKPGLFLQVKAFLENDLTKMYSLRRHYAQSGKVFQKILAGDSN